MKIIFWAIVGYIAYRYFFKAKPLQRGTSSQEKESDDDDYITIKIPKKKS
jgi:hypothetical protein